MKLPERVVVLLTLDGNILTHFSTDREEFAAVATHDRDRIFTLVLQGNLAGMQGMGLPADIQIDGAIYKEVDAWRISCRTIGKPRPRKRPRRTAKIIPFPGRAAR